MSTKQKFCGECGAQLGENDRFCPVCGAKVTDFVEPEKREPAIKKKPGQPPLHKHESSYNPQPNPSSPSRESIDSLWSENSLSSGFQWAIIWIIGWSPNWLHYGFFPEIVIQFILGAFIGGFSSGIILDKIVNRKILSLANASVFILFWMLFWGIVFGTQHVLYIDYDFRYIYISVLAFVLVFVAINILNKKYNLAITKKQSVIISISWSILTVISLILSNLIMGLL